jgi:hypothetical protein
MRMGQYKAITISILLVLLQGIYKFEWISVKIIFSIDLLAIGVYLSIHPVIIVFVCPCAQ